MIPKRTKVNATDLVQLMDENTGEPYAISAKDLFADLASGQSVQMIIGMIKSLEGQIKVLKEKKPVVKKKKDSKE